MHASIASAQRIQPRRSRRASADRSARYESVAVKRNIEYIRPYTPWKSSIQLGATSAVATSATARSARRATRATRSAGRSRSRRAADTTRRPIRPPPVCATTHAKRKWSGAPPRSPSTVRTRSCTEPRPVKSASVSSSCGGHALSRMKRKAATPAVSAATPRRHASSLRSNVAASKRGCGVVVAVVASFILGLSGQEATRCGASLL